MRAVDDLPIFDALLVIVSATSQNHVAILATGVQHGSGSRQNVRARVALLVRHQMSVGAWFAKRPQLGRTVPSRHDGRSFGEVPLCVGTTLKLSGHGEWRCPSGHVPNVEVCEYQLDAVSVPLHDGLVKFHPEPLRPFLGDRGVAYQRHAWIQQLPVDAPDIALKVGLGRGLVIGQTVIQRLGPDVVAHGRCDIGKDAIEEAVPHLLWLDASRRVSCRVDVQVVVTHVLGEPVEEQRLVEHLVERAGDLGCIHEPSLAGRTCAIRSSAGAPTRGRSVRSALGSCDAHAVELPPEDQPYVIDVGSVKGIPILHDDDPRLTEDRAKWSAATKKAQTLHSPDELLAGLRDPDWRVRHESVDRLVARAKDDSRTLPTLLETALSDEAWQVRDAVVMRLIDFDPSEVLDVLDRASRDPYPDVRESALYAIDQLDST